MSFSNQNSNKKQRKRIKKSVLLAGIIFFLIIFICAGSLIKGISSNSHKKNLSASSERTSQISELRTVVIDPSFGGEYAGSKGYGGVLQKDVNLSVALEIKKCLDRYDDIQVVLTRDSDKTVPYEDRVKLIEDSKADIVVSIQQNTEGSKKAIGFQTFVLGKDTYPESDSRLGYSIQQAMSMYIKSLDRGVMARNSDILKDAYDKGAVGALVYTGFITNKKESENLTNKEYLSKLGEGIAQGIMSYVDKSLNVTG